MSELDFLIKMRDGLQMAVDGITEYLESKAPVDKRWNPNKIEWIDATGTKGPYQKASNGSTEDAKNMLADLKEKGGKLTRSGYFYWLFTDQATVGRKKKGAKKTEKSSETVKPQEAAKGPIPLSPKGSSSKLEDVKSLFSKDLEDLLVFEQKEDIVTIRPRQWLGSENFSKVASIVRGVGGEYVSDGKNSHFRIELGNFHSS